MALRTTNPQDADEESKELADQASDEDGLVEEVLGDGFNDVPAEVLDEASHEVLYEASHEILDQDSSGNGPTTWHALPPAWILLPQVFLATGWLRAGAWHGLRSEWWSGQDLIDFAEAQSSKSILGYDLFLDGVVTSMPVAISVFVATIQLLVGLALLVNWRPLGALAAGAFLNVNFMLAGVVNPSVFYLVLAGGILSWHLDRNLRSETKAKLLRRCGPVALVAMIVLLFEVGSVHPESVTEDPASVMMFLFVLLTMMAWSLRDREGANEEKTVTDTQLCDQQS